MILNMPGTILAMSVGDDPLQLGYARPEQPKVGEPSGLVQSKIAVPLACH